MNNKTTIREKQIKDCGRKEFEQSLEGLVKEKKGILLKTMCIEPICKSVALENVSNF